DVHAGRVVVCMVDAESGEMSVHRLGGGRRRWSPSVVRCRARRGWRMRPPPIQAGLAAGPITATVRTGSYGPTDAAPAAPYLVDELALHVVDRQPPHDQREADQERKVAQVGEA